MPFPSQAFPKQFSKPKSSPAWAREGRGVKEHLRSAALEITKKRWPIDARVTLPSGKITTIYAYSYHQAREMWMIATRDEEGHTGNWNPEANIPTS